MKNTSQITCILDTSDSATALGFEAWVDDQQFINIDHVQEEHPILIELPDDESNHELKFVLKNKSISDTKVDDAGNIIKDATLIIKDLSFNEIKLGYIFTKLSVLHTRF